MLLKLIKAEIADLDNLLWFTPFLARRYRLLVELRNHILQGNKNA
jgi:hypothetical protein